MNLDIGVLWIEDSYSKEEEDSLRRRILDAGFVARIETTPNSTGIKELAQNHELYHCFDIILLDYKLQDEKGDEIAPSVRKLFPSTTILFYSGSLEESELRQKMAAKKIEGVYCSERRRFIERAGSLIDQTARSLNRLSGMRGLAMRVVAECDVIMKEAILSMAARSPECSEKKNELDDDVIGFIEQTKEKYIAAIKGDIEDRLATFAVDSTKLFKHFRRLTQIATNSAEIFGLDEDQSDRLRELRKSSANYDKEVLRKRNILGHVFEAQEASGWVLRGSDEINISDFPDIRRGFAKHIDTLREMNDLVTLLDRKQS
ncbi:response regulator [Pseudomonas citronellolis]|uniref:response regulator n=1 Tax=Pseudomonas citronellolis TaxID=53408 RepID=UPI0007185D7F|nr:response regulator [Pseudomonas citronellolis]KRV76310.1 histidine kinase [Pseudomonas citronellolis]KRW79655.1 histidine kinase [Pseudomonas citronellolis]